MKNLEQKTEKAYKTTLGDWVPGYGIWKTYKALKKGEPNIVTETENLGFANMLYQFTTLGIPGGYGLYELMKYVF